jgi:DNA polymerase V
MIKAKLKVTKVLSTGDFGEVKLPIYNSRVAAGFPLPGDDLVEDDLDLNELLVRNPTATFFVRVEGDSMEKAKIFSGDILIVDRSVSVKTGQIVVAAVSGEMVVKKIVISNHQMSLVSEQDGYQPIIINDNEDCYVWGVVIGSVRTF